jgi:2-polyprenyl-3-methyl-5-hydroxy-6-metoxy-1,4-benzoquinol methylase
MASTYDAAKSRNDVYYSTLKSCFDRAVPATARGRVLDVGCGTGQILAALRPRQGVGTDLSENMIQTARRQFVDRPELQFLAVDGSALNGLGEFDSVISADVMEHVEDWKQVVATIVRACRAGGAIAISTPNPGWTFPLWVLEKLRMKMPEGPHRFVSGKRIAKHLRNLGCEVVSRGTSLICPARLGGLGPRISAIAESWPLFRNWGVIQIIVARKSANQGKTES